MIDSVSCPPGNFEFVPNTIVLVLSEFVMFFRRLAYILLKLAFEKNTLYY